MTTLSDTIHILVNLGLSAERTTNRCPAPYPNVDPNGDETGRGNRNLAEAEITAEIGQELGFEIDAENPILREVLGESSECNGFR